MKAVHFWQDSGSGDYRLWFLRDKSRREVDFLITKNNAPWIIVEVKSSQKSGLTQALQYYYKTIHPQHAFQVVFDMDYVDNDCFALQRPVIVPVQTFLSQLV